MDPLTNGIHNAAQAVTSPVLRVLADGACELGTLGSDILAAIEEIDLASGEMEDCGGEMVCDAYGTEQIGSVATSGTDTLPDGTTVESVTVQPVDGQVCIESHVEFACATI